MNRFGSLVVVAVMLSIACSFELSPGQTEPYYQGKTLRILVGSAPGAGNDLRTRLFARHVKKHLPGAPQIIVQNMAGGGGSRARNYLYNIADRDGLTIAEIIRGTAFEDALGLPSVRYKANEFNWIGNMTTGAPICTARIDRAGETLEEAIKLSKKRQLRDAESGVAVPSAAIARLLKQFTGLNVVVVSGYRGGAAMDLAMRKGEADMRCGLVWSSAKARNADWYKRLGSKKPFAAVLVQTSPTRLPDLSDVPTLMELAPNAEWRKVAEVITFTYQNAYPILAPPGVSPDIVKLLREAFWATMQDPEYKADGEKIGFIGDEPLPGDKVQELVTQIVDMPEDSKRLLKQVMPKIK